MTMFMILLSCPKSLWEFTWLIWWMQTECRLAAKLQIKPVDLGCESAKNWQLPFTSTVAIFIITQPISWHSFCQPMEGGRLNWPMHCCKVAQPMPKAVYHCGCCDNILNYCCLHCHFFNLKTCIIITKSLLFSCTLCLHLILTKWS